jgi:hypothetical protein
MSDVAHAPSDPTTIYCDNQGAISTSKDDAFHPRTKHIAMRYHLVREKTEGREVTLTYIPTADMAADFFTKSLPRDKLDRLFPLIGLSRIKPPLASGGVLNNAGAGSGAAWK